MHVCVSVCVCVMYVAAHNSVLQHSVLPCPRHGNWRTALVVFNSTWHGAQWSVLINVSWHASDRSYCVVYLHPNHFKAACNRPAVDVKVIHLQDYTELSNSKSWSSGLKESSRRNPVPHFFILGNHIFKWSGVCVYTAGKIPYLRDLKLHLPPPPPPPT